MVNEPASLTKETVLWKPVWHHFFSVPMTDKWSTWLKETILLPQLPTPFSVGQKRADLGQKVQKQRLSPWRTDFWQTIRVNPKSFFFLSYIYRWPQFTTTYLIVPKNFDHVHFYKPTNIGKRINIYMTYQRWELNLRCFQFELKVTRILWIPWTLWMNDI